jgi:hypothetical protein
VRVHQTLCDERMLLKQQFVQPTLAVKTSTKDELKTKNLLQPKRIIDNSDLTL